MRYEDSVQKLSQQLADMRADVAAVRKEVNALSTKLMAVEGMVRTLGSLFADISKDVRKLASKPAPVVVSEAPPVVSEDCNY